MTRHTLEGRTDDEVLWWQRRSFIQAAAAWTAMGGFAAAHAQQRSNIVDFTGEATINGEPLTRERTIQTGDSLLTGPKSNLIFVIGDSSFQVRQNTRFTVERGASLFAVSVLRLLSGGIAAVWGKGPHRQITTPTLTAGIRGTGTYTEVFDAQDFRSYFCNCYGTIDVNAGEDKVVSQSSYHQSFWGEAHPKNGHVLTAANAINHTDEELEYLAKLVGQQTAWQVEGRKGIKNGMGYMDPVPPSMHPANELK
ncbi:MAG TPA: iron dicitrate transport regulator FecR [Ramlibacter sp.]|jgi:hypothetical protein|nr:iron dicitrate transport regulator FecR [Ramlibacter sp.]